MSEKLSQQQLQQLRNYIVHASHLPQEMEENLRLYLGAPHLSKRDLILRDKDLIYKGVLPKDWIVRVANQTYVLEAKTHALRRSSIRLKYLVESSQGQKNRRQDSPWFNYFIWCVPKQIREPWFGDLCEDRERMANAGLSRWRIEFATAVQFLFLIGAVLWNFVLKLNPFRSRFIDS